MHTGGQKHELVYAFTLFYGEVSTLVLAPSLLVQREPTCSRLPEKQKGIFALRGYVTFQPLIKSSICDRIITLYYTLLFYATTYYADLKTLFIKAKQIYVTAKWLKYRDFQQS